MPPTLHTNFTEVKAHTAKCDNCNNHNTHIIRRCVDCGTQCCTPCWNARGDDGRHVINGGDQNDPAKRLITKKTTEPAARITSIKSVSQPVKRRSARSKRTLEDEDEEQGEERQGKLSSPVKKPNQRKSPRYQFRQQNQNLISSQQSVVEDEHSPSIIDAAKFLLATAIPSGVPSPPMLTHSNRRSSHSRSHSFTDTDTLPSHFTFPPGKSSITSDDQGITFLLQAAAEIDKPLPRSSQSSSEFPTFNTSDSEWYQDAQPRSPLPEPEDLDLNTQSDKGTVAVEEDETEDKREEKRGKEEKGGRHLSQPKIHDSTLNESPSNSFTSDAARDVHSSTKSIISMDGSETELESKAPRPPPSFAPLATAPLPLPAPAPAPIPAPVPAPAATPRIPVAPRLRNLYWEVQTFRSSDGRVRRLRRRDS